MADVVVAAAGRDGAVTMPVRDRLALIPALRWLVPACRYGPSPGLLAAAHNGDVRVVVNVVGSFYES